MDKKMAKNEDKNGQKMTKSRCKCEKNTVKKLAENRQKLLKITKNQQ